MSNKGLMDLYIEPIQAKSAMRFMPAKTPSSSSRPELAAIFLRTFAADDVSDDCANNQSSSTPKTTGMFRFTGGHPFCFATGSRGVRPGWALPRAGNHYSIEFFILAENRYHLSNFRHRLLPLPI